MLNVVFQNVRLLDPARGVDRITDFVVRDGVVQPEGAPRDGLKIVNCKDHVVLPGLRDVHVHFRDPGCPEAETRATGSAAAAAGGFTCVTTMPNTVPAGDNVAWIREQIEDRSLPVRIAPSACVTAGRAGKAVADLEALAAAGAAAFTDDGAMVADESVMREAMRRAGKLGKPVMEHAVVPSILAGGVIRDCHLSRRLGLPVMPPEAETEAVRRDIALARETGCHIHIQHISVAATVDLIRAARAEGLPVSGEATPHHIFLACEDIPADDGNLKMAPPLGTKADRAAVRAGVLDGTLALFATDHAPHTAARKAGGFRKAANGIIGLETAAAITWFVMVEVCGMKPLDWAARWVVGPAELLGEKPRTLAPGGKADLALINLAANRIVDPDSFKSRSRNTPFAGLGFAAWPVLTAHEGEVTYGHEILR